MSPHPTPAEGGIRDATYGGVNAVLQARVRRILTREFYRRGQLTWDMKMALQRALEERWHARRTGKSAPHRP